MRQLWWGALVALALGCAEQAELAPAQVGDAQVGAGGGGGAGGGADGAGGEGGGYVPPPEACAPQAVEAPARLLTRFEWDNTVRDLLGDARRLATARLPAENEVLGLDNSARYHQATPVLVEGLMGLAEDVAITAVAERPERLLMGCTPAVEGVAGCGRRFVQDFGRLVFRRALTADEAAVFAEAFEVGRAAGGLDEGLRITLAAMLQSPQFLYRLTAPTPSEGEGEAVPLVGWVRASRLSYFLWGSTPDEALLAAAEAGALDTAEGVAAQVRRMLPDPRTRATVQHFHRQWLGLDALAQMEKDHPYPGGVEALRAVLARSVEALVDEAFAQGVDALLSGPSVYVDADLAALLGLPAPAGDFGPVAAPADQRAGLLTHPALLAKLAHPDQTSPIHRGIFVRERLLCQALPPPPADLIIEPPDPDPSATTRDRFAQHTADPACAGCHTLMDPVGFGFENYDELGRFRQTENGLPVDASGELVAPPTPDLAGPFDGAVALADRLAGSPAVKQCVATWWFRYAMARGELPADACARARIEDAFIDSGGDFTALMVALATSGAFTHRAGTPSDPAVTPEPEPDPEPEPTGQAPRGVLDGVRAAGVAYGWAFDPDAPAQVTAVDLYLDGAPGEGLYLGSFRADQPRPDVTAAYPEAVGGHGFEVALPEVARDGRPHTLYGLALDDGTGDPAPLQQTGQVFRAGLNADAEVNPSYEDGRLPEGFVDNVSAAGVVSGWALDRDVAPAGIEVHVYVDGPALLGGEFAGSTTTGLARPDVNDALGVPGDHGYAVRLPDRFMDGRPHIVFVYAFNGGHPGNAMLSRSPFEYAGGRR